MKYDTNATRKALDDINAVRNVAHRIPANSNPVLVLDGLATAQNLCYGLAAHSGWWIDTETGEDVRTWPKKFLKLWVISKLMLSVGELSEGLESYRKGDRNDDHLPDMNGLTVEIADCIIRLLDLAGGLDLPVPEAVVRKLAYNQKRPDHKLEHRSADGGKSI